MFRLPLEVIAPFENMPVCCLLAGVVTGEFATFGRVVSETREPFKGLHWQPSRETRPLQRAERV